MKYSILLAVVIFASSCVPSKTFESQKAKLAETETKLREAEEHARECDPNDFIQLKEQAQSLDLLSQELVDRNTELSKEVARLRTVEAACKSEESDCQRKLDALKADFESKIERTQKSYEDLIRELRVQVRTAQEALQKQSEAAKALQKVKDSKPKAASAPKAPAPAPKKSSPEPKK